MTEQVRKICLLGDFAVGKSSTVRQFVESRYDEKYLSTVGVKIDTKTVQLPATELKLVIWDLAGTDVASATLQSYLKGMSGYLLVVDGTRPETLESALSLQAQLSASLGELPWVGLLNKEDLVDEWRLDASRLDARGGDWLKTSAKTGANIEAAFLTLAEQLCPR